MVMEIYKKMDELFYQEYGRKLPPHDGGNP
jgi:hypothetical protein